MHEEYTISNAAAEEVVALIHEALVQKASGFNLELLAEVKIALDFADRIIIEHPKAN